MTNCKDNYHLRVCSNCKHYSVFKDYDVGIISIGAENER